MEFWKKTIMGDKIFFFVLVSVISVIGVSGLEICACDDVACIQSAAEAGFQAAVNQDPICIGEISGEETDLGFNFTNICLDKFSQCQISDVRSDWESYISFKLFCDDFNVFGNSQLSGTLFRWTPVHGSGPFQIDCTGYKIEVRAKLKKVIGPDGQEVYEMEGDKLRMGSEGHVYAFENLYEGEPNARQKSIDVHALANTLWRYVEGKMQHHIIAPYMTKWYENANIYLRQIPASVLCTK